MSHHVIRSNADLSAYIASGGSPEYLLFWGHQPMKNSAIGKTCFSQWFESAFIVDDIRYRTAEHYVMAEKARLFEDSSAWQRILDATKPAAVKAIGREIQGLMSRCGWRIAGPLSSPAIIRNFLKTSICGNFC